MMLVDALEEQAYAPASRVINQVGSPHTRTHYATLHCIALHCIAHSGAIFELLYWLNNTVFEANQTRLQNTNQTYISSLGECSGPQSLAIASQSLL